jgi:hypothetical protein
MRQSAADRVSFPTQPRPLAASFDVEQLTSDDGLLWLVEADKDLGLSVALAAAIPGWRRGPVRHALATLVRQRLHSALGYRSPVRFEEAMTAGRLVTCWQPVH